MKIILVGFLKLQSSKQNGEYEINVNSLYY